MNPQRSIAAVILFLVAITAGAAEPSPGTSVSFFVSARGASHDRNLSEGDLRRIFLGEISRWPNGHRIVLYVRPFDSAAGRLFLDRLIRMSDIDYAQWWLGAVFRGRAAAAPRVMTSTDAMSKAVAANADAIGFDSQQAHDTELLVLTIDGRAPGDARYAIRAR
jgi:ABC-type phosphate transport system substrate-binding protein